MSRRLLGLVAIFGALSTVPLAGTRSTFVPDWTFKGSTLAGWHVLGAADWKAVDGELVGTPKSADGGWLVLDKSFQDVEFGADFKCVGACRTGVLLRAEKTPTGMKGVFLSLDEGEVGGYAVTLDANGKILTRERLRPGGGLMRVAPSAADAAAAAAARGGGAGRGAGAGTRCAWRARRAWRPRARCAALGRDAAQPDGALRTQAERLERPRCRDRRQHPAAVGEHRRQRRRRGRRRSGQVWSYRDLRRRLRRGALPRRLVSRSEPQTGRQGRAVAELPDAAAHAVLLFVRVGRRRFRSRRQHGHRLGTVHFPGTGFHEGARVLHGALHQPLDQLLVQLARVRRRLYRRRLARRAAGVNVGHAVVRESERRAEAMGFARAASCRRRPTSRKCRR